MNSELPTRDRGATDIPSGEPWISPTTIGQLENLLKVMCRWAEAAEKRHV
ncbi:hypothetical protein [Nocardia carnea]|uniref:Integrase n=1 Tax=Nocardia carnea TaxID=37328 RepID=A0ABW7TJM8_9NOCA|nr:hypothetical protein [Nocardia carnea]